MYWTTDSQFRITHAKYALLPCLLNAILSVFVWAPLVGFAHITNKTCSIERATDSMVSSYTSYCIVHTIHIDICEHGFQELKFELLWIRSSETMCICGLLYSDGGKKRISKHIDLTDVNDLFGFFSLILSCEMHTHTYSNRESTATKCTRMNERHEYEQKRSIVNHVG